MTPVQEYDAIVQAIQPYIDGAKTGKGDAMKPTFHADATIFGYVGADLISGPIQGLYDWNDGNGPAKDLQLRIASVDIAGTVATVRLEMDNWTGHRFTDMMALLKVDGQWKVMCKLFHLHEG